MISSMSNYEVKKVMFQVGFEAQQFVQSEQLLRSPAGYLSEDGDGSMVNSPIGSSPQPSQNIEDPWR